MILVDIDISALLTELYIFKCACPCLYPTFDSEYVSMTYLWRVGGCLVMTLWRVGEMFGDESLIPFIYFR